MKPFTLIIILLSFANLVFNIISFSDSIVLLVCLYFISRTKIGEVIDCALYNVFLSLDYMDSNVTNAYHINENFDGFHLHYIIKTDSPMIPGSDVKLNFNNITKTAVVKSCEYGSDYFSIMGKTNRNFSSKYIDLSSEKLKPNTFWYHTTTCRSYLEVR